MAAMRPWWSPGPSGAISYGSDVASSDFAATSVACSMGCHSRATSCSSAAPTDRRGQEMFSADLLGADPSNAAARGKSGDAAADDVTVTTIESFRRLSWEWFMARRRPWVRPATGTVPKFKGPPWRIYATTSRPCEPISTLLNTTGPRADQVGKVRDCTASP
jgi:hypothetical protein